MKPLLRCSSFTKKRLTSQARYDLRQQCPSDSFKLQRHAFEVKPRVLLTPPSLTPSSYFKDSHGSRFLKKDPLSVVYAASNTLVRLGVFDGEYIVIKSELVDNNTTGTMSNSDQTISRVVCIRCHDTISQTLQKQNNVDADKIDDIDILPIIAIPPTLALNLKVLYKGFLTRIISVQALDVGISSNKISSNITKPATDQNGDKEFSELQHNNVSQKQMDGISFASNHQCLKLTIRRIRSSNEVAIPAASISVALHSFFNTPRLLHVGDTLLVPTWYKQRDTNRGIKWNHCLYRGKMNLFSDTSDSDSTSEASDSDLEEMHTEIYDQKTSLAEDGDSSKNTAMSIIRQRRRIQSSSTILVFQVSGISRDKSSKCTYFETLHLPEFGWCSVNSTQLTLDGFVNARRPNAHCLHQTSAFLCDRMNQKSLTCSQSQVSNRKIFHSSVKLLRSLVEPTFGKIFLNLRQITPILLYGVRYLDICNCIVHF